LAKACGAALPSSFRCLTPEARITTTLFVKRTTKLGDHQVTWRIDQQGKLQQGLDEMNWPLNNGPFKGPSSYHRFYRWC
jgi:hypothetical protein